MIPVVKFENIHFIRDRREILKGIDWEINENEVWALIGLNGSGKSTLLGMIPAYTYPSIGKVQVLGQDFGGSDWRELRKKIGYVSSNMKTFTKSLNSQKIINVVRSGAENTIGFTRKLTSEEEAYAQKLIENFNLVRVKEKRYSLVSQGEARRALIARAFMSKPKLMVLDEPTTGLDLRGREDLLLSLSDFVSIEKKPIIYVTHNLEELIPEISHVAIMEDGLITSQGRKKDVISEENLKKLYGLNLELEWTYGRPWIKIKDNHIEKNSV